MPSVTGPCPAGPVVPRVAAQVIADEHGIDPTGTYHGDSDLQLDTRANERRTEGGAVWLCGSSFHLSFLGVYWRFWDVGKEMILDVCGVREVCFAGMRVSALLPGSPGRCQKSQILEGIMTHDPVIQW